MTERFDTALYGVPPRIKQTLEQIPQSFKAKTEEIRLRTGLPVSLTVDGSPLFVRENGTVSNIITRDLITAEKSELEDAFLRLCRNSVYAHTGELKDGYIMMRSGHRAGVCGTFTESGQLKDISSLNIRISRQILGCADLLADEFDGGMLIAGPPCSGKTTLLRDLVRQLSSGCCGGYKRVAVIDSRGEISGSHSGVCENELGVNTDILMTADKALGVEIAVRTLFPDVIAFDEIGTAAELERVSESFNAGVTVVTTAHAGGFTDLLRRSVTYGLICSGAISKVVLLSSEIGKTPQIIPAQVLLCADDY